MLIVWRSKIKIGGESIILLSWIPLCSFLFLFLSIMTIFLTMLEMLDLQSNAWIATNDRLKWKTPFLVSLESSCWKRVCHQVSERNYPTLPIPRDFFGTLLRSSLGYKGSYKLSKFILFLCNFDFCFLYSVFPILLWCFVSTSVACCSCFSVIVSPSFSGCLAPSSWYLFSALEEHRSIVPTTHQFLCCCVSLQGLEGTSVSSFLS